jgi:DNA repair photolyase
MGKSIYESKGKAGEYSKYAVSFFCGCSCGCHYCYNKTGRFKSTLGGNVPTLKKCFEDETHALKVFEKELKQNLPELQKHGLFFSFTTDPMLPEAKTLTLHALYKCLKWDVPVKILTKCTAWMNDIEYKQYLYLQSDIISFGFTLTGHDELEPNASSNKERIEAMLKLHDAGFKTWASIEPVIDVASSFKMVRDSRHFCDLFKVGIESGKKYDKDVLRRFIYDVIEYTEYFGCKLYFKDSLLKQAGINREDLPSNCVTRDYNIFNQ